MAKGRKSRRHFETKLETCGLTSELCTLLWFVASRGCGMPFPSGSQGGALYVKCKTGTFILFLSILGWRQRNLRLWIWWCKLTLSPPLTIYDFCLLLLTVAYFLSLHKAGLFLSFAIWRRRFQSSRHLSGFHENILSPRNLLVPVCVISQFIRHIPALRLLQFCWQVTLGIIFTCSIPMPRAEEHESLVFISIIRGILTLDSPCPGTITLFATPTPNFPSCFWG